MPAATSPPSPTTATPIRSESQIGPGQTVSAQVPGENTTGTGPAGLLADSRSGADLFRDLISLQQNLTSGNTAAIASTDSPNLTKDENNIVSGIAANGVLQSTLESASTAATQLGTSITTQTSNLTSADLATTLTNWTRPRPPIKPPCKAAS